MATSKWLEDSRRFIKELDRDIPNDADLKARRKALRENGWRLHGGTFWGRRQWGKAVREYLEQHGQPKRPAPILADQPDLPDDIIFPFRGLA